MSQLELGRLHLVALTGAATQRDIYAATGIQPPPRITALQPA